MGTDGFCISLSVDVNKGSERKGEGGGESW